MTTPDTGVLESLVDTERYPVTAPDSAAWRAMVSRVQTELRETGCSVLAGFVRPELIGALRAEGVAAAPHAHYEAATVNVYNLDLDRAAALPPGHPGRVTMRRGNAFVPRDRIAADSVIARLYTDPGFQRLVAGCFQLPRLYELADPLAGLVLNVIRPGREHPWHFDTNEFTVSLLTQPAEAGGTFEFCPHIRTAHDEHLAAVAGVLDGTGAHRIRRLDLRPGDLQLFQGRYALHRVSPVAGQVARHTAIFAYSERPGVIGTPARTSQLFGRVLPAHLAAARERVDQLLD